MSLNFSSTQKHLKIPKGQSIMQADMQADRFFIVVHSGKTSIITYPTVISGQQNDQKYYFCLKNFAANSFLGTLSFYSDKPYYYNARAEEDSEISIYPMKDVDTLCASYPKILAQLLRQMNQSLEVYEKNIEMLKIISSHFEDLNNKLMLYLDKKLLAAVKQDSKMLADRINVAKQNASRLKINVNREKIFITPTTSLLEAKVYQLSPSITQAQRAILTLDSETLKSLFVKNPNIATTLYHTIACELVGRLKSSYDLVSYLYKEWFYLGECESSILQVLPIISKSLPKKWAPEVIATLQQTKKKILDSLHKNEEQLRTLLGVEVMIGKHLNQLDFLHSDAPANVASASGSASAATASASPTTSSPQPTRPTIDVYAAISKVSDVDKDLIQKVKTAHAALKNIKNIFEASSDERKIIKQANDIFIKFYTELFLKLKLNNTSLPKGIDLFFYYGILEPNQLSANIIPALPPMQRINTPQPASKKNICVVHLYEWLNLIFDEKEYPSNSEFGISYKKFLIDKKKRMSTKEKEAFEERPTEEKKIDIIDYEMQNMVTACMRLVSETPTKTVHAISDLNVPKSIDNFIITKEKIQEAVHAVLKIDYQLFTREGLYKLTATANEIVQVDILPYFVIMPTIGSNIMFWQEIYGTSKQTRGRFIVPLIYTGNFKENMLKCLSEFRWELCRTSKGVSWMDPIDGGISGAFYDYLVSFKKNSKLSPEAKEKIRTLITASRKDTRRAFVTTYKLWIEFESRGVMKMDPVARDFFFRWIPFSKESRNRLVKIPAYEKGVNRHNHQSGRMVENLDRKYRNHTGEDGKIVPILQDNINFYTK